MLTEQIYEPHDRERERERVWWIETYTFFLSLMDPFPRTMILQPVSDSSCLAVSPRGPRILPTKLNCAHTQAPKDRLEGSAAEGATGLSHLGCLELSLYNVRERARAASLRFVHL